MAGEGTEQNSENEHLSPEEKLKKKDSFKNGDLNYEQERIKSFASWPVHFPVDPIRLAKAGFYFTGNEDEVICFSCHGIIKDWNYGDVVLKKHAELFPDCDFVNNRSNNIPILKSSGKINGDKKIIETIDNITKSSECKSIINYDKMKSENERIKSFNEKWPLSYINMAEIARAGFFYLGYEDKVQCPYCKGIVSNWGVGDDPLEEHVKHFPWCEFLSNSVRENFKAKNCWFQTGSQDVCGNMKRNVAPGTYNNAVRCKLLDKSQQHINLKRLGVHLHKGPAHPEQASLSARLRSFVSWPSSALVSKEDLAEAGFFYIGIKDHTKCFHCNGGLCNWEADDDPWIEHARWFCNCDFLRLNKGDGFIESCLKKYPKASVSAPSPSSIHYPEMLMKKVDDAMGSDIVKYVLETGMFPSYIVRAAVLRQIKITGSNFSDIDELCIAVSYLKEEMEKEPFKMNIDDDSDINVCQSVMENCVISSAKESPLSSCDANVNNLTSDSVSQVESNIRCSGIQQSLHTGQANEDLTKDQCLCKICMDNEVGVVFLPCGHLLACTVCAPALQFCPMCRKTIQATVRAYLN